MKRCSAITIALAFIAFSAVWHSQEASSQSSTGWVTLFDGGSLDSWNVIGDANWKLADGIVVADKGNGFLVSKNSYTDFQIRAEFWVDDDANSGIFLRCDDTKNLNAKICYEVTIFDKRPAPEYGTGAIVDVAKVVPMPKAGGKWNTYEIMAQGSHLVVALNGVKTVDVQNSQHKSGPIALQYGPGVVKDAGVVKFRKVEIKPL
jgi:hypothetical protein